MNLKSKLYLLVLFLGVWELANGYDAKEDTFNPPFPLTVHLCGTVFFAGICIVLIKIINIPIPQGVFPLTIGVLFGIAVLHSHYVKHTMAKYILPTLKPGCLELLYFTALLLQISFCIDINAFARCLVQIFIVSGPVSLLTAGICGCVMRLVVNTAWDYTTAMLLGFLCIPILPLDVVEQLEEFGTITRHSIVMLQGETIIGLTFFLVYFFVANQYFLGQVQFWYDIISSTFIFVLSGCAAGMISGSVGVLLLPYLATDVGRLLAFIFTFSLFVCFFLAVVIDLSALVGVMIAGLVMGRERSALPSETDSIIVDIAKTFFLALNNIIYFRSGALCVMHGFNNVEVIHAECVFGLILYLILYVSRFLSYLLFMPILNRLGYGMPISNIIICAWGGIKSPMVVYFVIMVGSTSTQLDSAMASTFLPILLVLLYLSIVINGSLHPLLLKWMGLYDLSMVKKINMNNCMKHLLLKRDTSVTILKSDRYLSDTNWPMVYEGTQITHPYKIDMADVEDVDEYILGYKYTTCPDCNKTIMNEPTRQELKEMKREARLRILKAKNLSYSRQFECGMLSKEGMRVLRQAVEITMDNPDELSEFDSIIKVLENEGLVLQSELRKFKSFTALNQEYSRKFSSLQLHATYRKCFSEMVNSRYFGAVVYLILTLNIIFNATEQILGDIDTMLHRYAFGLTNIIFDCLYLFELILKIFVSSNQFQIIESMKLFFNVNRNIVETILVIFGVVDIGVISIYVFEKQFFFEAYKPYIIMRYFRAIRYFFLLRYLRVYCPWFSAIFSTSVDIHQALAYEIGKSYISAIEDILEMLPFIIDHDQIRNEIKHGLRNNRMVVAKVIAIVHKDKPGIGITVKTIQAIRSVLNTMRDTVNDLKMSGWADDSEHTKLLAAVNERYKYVSLRLKHIEPNSPETVFKEVLWMGDEISEKLFKKAILLEFPPGQAICQQGFEGKGIYVIVSGLVVMSYSPTRKVLDNLRFKGCIPVIEFMTGLKLGEGYEDFIVAGNCIGELAFLTGRPFDCTITADTTCQAYLLSSSVLRNFVKDNVPQFNNLECRIWRSVATKIALPILQEQAAYQNYSQEQLKLSLEKSFVPNLANVDSLTTTDSMKDIILIEGTVTDDHTKEVFVAPCCILKTSKKLLLNNKAEDLLPIMLIIPEHDTDSLMCQMHEEHATPEVIELCRVRSSKCLLHNKQSDTVHSGTDRSMDDGDLHYVMDDENEEAKKSDTQL